METAGRTIEDVIERLDEIIAESHEWGSRLGFFPAMYRKTTLEVKKALEEGRFEDPERMHRLDVVFADRYFKAYEQHQRGEEPTEAWCYAFETAERDEPSVLQHLLLGMNAHINLDLGIVAAEIAPGDQLYALERDFHEINAILGELTDRVQTDLASLFPLLRALDWLGGRLDERMCHFSLVKARSAAWERARMLAELDSERQWAPHIKQFDAATVRFARAICPPRQQFRRRRDSPDEIRQIIEALHD